MLAWLMRKKSNSERWQMVESTTVPGFAFPFLSQNVLLAPPEGAKNRVWWRFWTTTNVRAGLYPSSSSKQPWKWPRGEKQSQIVYC